METRERRKGGGGSCTYPENEVALNLHALQAAVALRDERDPLLDLDVDPEPIYIQFGYSRIKWVQNRGHIVLY
jgi:hypothetical protein